MRLALPIAATAPHAGHSAARIFSFTLFGYDCCRLNEQRSHFALWCLMKSPLIIGTDVRKLAPDALRILLNNRLIAVNQDALVRLPIVGFATAAGKGMVVVLGWCGRFAGLL